MKEALGLDTDAELATRLGVAHATIGAWKARDTLDYKLIIDASLNSGANLHWLFTGVGRSTISDTEDVQAFISRTETRLKRLERRYEELGGH